MATNVNLRKLLHRKAWESCTSAPVASAAGSFVVSDKFDINNGARAFYVANASSIWLYEGQEDAWCQLPASGATGVFAAGACGEYRAMGAMGGTFTQTATAGTTSTITTNRTIVRSLENCRIRVVAGAGMGYEGTVIDTLLGTNAVLTVSPASGAAFNNTTQFQVYSGSLWLFVGGTSAVGYSVYDVATNAWTARAVTGLPTAWGTTGQLCSTMGAVSTFATGTATAATTTTLTTAKAWSVNMWNNYQVRITSGTGKGQLRTITSNTATALTVSAAWTITPDATSQYSIEGNDDYFYLLGNNSVAMYRYSVSANAWTTLAPTVARAGAMAAGGTADWIDSATDWNNENAVPHYSTTLVKQNGRYIYSFRGGATSTLDVYDIPANAWVSNVIYGNQAETFTTGSSSIDYNGQIWMSKESTGRLFRFDVDKNRMLPMATNTTQVALAGTAVDGDKMFILPYNDGGTSITFGYVLRHSGPDLVRMMMI